MQKKIVAVCEICGWEHEINLSDVESGKLKPADPILVIEKHLQESHDVEPFMVMREKSNVIN